MKEYNKDGLKFNYKENLDEDDFITSIKTYLEVYNNGIDGAMDNIAGLHKNPILAERAFNLNIGNFCIENFNAELHEKIFNAGVYQFLKDDIKNVKEAYELAKEIAKRVDSVDELVYSFLNKIIELIPSDTNINDLINAWNKVSSEYKEITK